MNYYFTFGSGSPLSKYYVRIDANDENQARCRMVCLFTHHWAGVYSSIKDVEKYNYKELDINSEGSVRLQTNYEEPRNEIYINSYPWVRE